MPSKPRKLLKIPDEYLEAIQIGRPLFSPLFQFENGLRLALHKYMTILYSEDWWETSLKDRLPDLYQYVEEQKVKRDNMPWIGDSSRTNLLPLHSLTLGQLQKIVEHYRSEIIPDLFPNIEFFTGHMEIIKRVRNLFSHMYPCITSANVATANREIQTLTEHLNAKL